jgi:hypothetical protein
LQRIPAPGETARGQAKNSRGQVLAPRFATTTAQRSTSSSCAPPTREVFAPRDRRRSSLPRFATGLAQETKSSGTAPRGQVGGRREGKLRLSVIVGMFFVDGLSIMNLILHSRPSTPGLARRSRGGTPTREFFASKGHRCSSLPRFATITAQEKELGGDAPRGQAGAGLSRQPLGRENAGSKL